MGRFDPRDNGAHRCLARVSILRNVLISPANQNPHSTEYLMSSTRDFATTKDGLKIRYEIRGSGDPLALIMGFSGSGRAWGDAFLNNMERRFQTVVIDNRGTGESDKPDQPWTLTDMAND